MAKEADGATRTLEALMGRTVRVALRDGRWTVGKLLCVDKQANVVLGDCQEHRPLPGQQDEVCAVGTAIFARRDVVSVHVRPEPSSAQDVVAS